MSPRKIILLSAAFTVFICAGFIAVRYSYLFNKSLFSGTSTEVIYIDENGFSPNKIEIGVNSKVIFKNTDTREHWPASNIHPSHEIYPEFDPKKALKPGEEWSFVFKRSGIWKFHDHYYPQLTGTITVSGDEKGNNTPFDFLRPRSGQVAQDKQTKKDEEDFENLPLVEKNSDKILTDNILLKAYVKQYGVAEAMASIIKLSNYGSSVDCHQQAHEVGRIGYKLSGSLAFKQCDAACHSGCYHGAMEGFLNQKGTENLAENINQICETFETSFGTFECLHGVGHGVLAYLDYDMPATIEECAKLKDGFSHTSCYGGMFMENILTGLGYGANKESHSTTWLNNTDPYFPCNAVSQEYEVQFQCYQMQTSWMLKITNYDFDKVAQYCLKAPEGYKQVCFKSLGRDAGGQTLRNPDSIVKICSTMPSENDYIDQCYKGAVNVIIDFWGPNLKGQASELCKKIINATHKNNCYSSIAERISGLSNDKNIREMICNTFETAYQKLCKIYTN